jgi:hypothetical protein
LSFNTFAVDDDDGGEADEPIVQTARSGIPLEYFFSVADVVVVPPPPSEAVVRNQFDRCAFASVLERNVICIGWVVN